MKKILFVALAATLLAAGCQKTEVINRVGDVMTFSTEMNKLTKADEGTTTGDLTTLKAQQFKVWAYTAYEDQLNGVTPGEEYDGIAGLVIKYDETSDKWVTVDNKDYYWPGKENDLEFYGISTGFAIVTDKPEKEGEPAVNTVITPGTGRKIVITGYTVTPTTATDDLMIADFVTQNQTDKTDKSVSMHFNHALSKVTFAFNTAGSKQVKVTKLEVLDLNTSGVLTVEENAAVANDQTRTSVSLSWTKNMDNFTAAKGNFVREFTGDDSILATGDHVTFTTWLVIPQVLTNKNVKIYYSIGEKSFTHVFPLANATALPNGWEVNQSITYNVTLSPNTISFVPSVQDWEEKTPITEVN